MRALPLAALALVLAVRPAPAAEELAPTLPRPDPVALSFQTQVATLLPLATEPAGMAQALSDRLASPQATDADRVAASLLIRAAGDPRTAAASAAAPAAGAGQPALAAAIGRIAALPAEKREAFVAAVRPLSQSLVASGFGGGDLRTSLDRLFLNARDSGEIVASASAPVDASGSGADKIVLGLSPARSKPAGTRRDAASAGIDPAIPGGALPFERQRSLLNRHEKAIRALAGFDLYERGLHGILDDGLAYETVFRSGKQQPVQIVRLTFPEGGSFDVVFRPTRNNFERLYAQYEVVRKHFPRLLLSESGGSQSVLVLERIDGYEEKLNAPEFEAFIAAPNRFEQLCRETFDIVNELYQQPLILHDIEPATGHNMIFNTRTGAFQLFDVDTLASSDRPFEEKFMEFVNPGQPIDEPKTRYLMRMLQLYLARYPHARLSYEGEPELINKFSTPERAFGKITKTIKPGDAGYDEAYRKGVHWLGPRGKTDLPVLVRSERRGRDRYFFAAELLEAARRNDFERFDQIVKSLDGKIIKKEFIEDFHD